MTTHKHLHTNGANQQNNKERSQRSLALHKETTQQITQRLR